MGGVLSVVVFFVDLSMLSYLTSIVSGDVKFGVFSAFFFCLSFFAFRVYDSGRLNSLKEQIPRILVSGSFAILVIILLEVLFGVKKDNSLLLLPFSFSVAVFPFYHWLGFGIFLRLHPTKKCLVVGKRYELEHVIREIEKASFGRLQCVGWTNPSTTEITFEPALYDIVLIADPRLEDEARRRFESMNKLRFRYLHEVAERFLNRIPLEVAVKFKDYYTELFSKVEEPPSKRLLDVVCSIILLIFFSFFMLAISLAIMIEDGLPVVFKQERVGKNGKSFTMWKFRSMKNITKDVTRAKFATDEEHRILKVGRFVRPFRLDETLQFWNVLRGEMSLVGPRPEQIPLVEEFKREIPFYNLRHRVRPGITGWAQLMYRYAANKEETVIKLSYDLWYIKNRSFLLDLRIILQTIEAVLWKRGAK